MLRELLDAFPPSCLLLEQTADHQDLGQPHSDHDEELEGRESVDAGEVGLCDVAVSSLVHFDQVLKLDGLVQVPLGSVNDALKVRDGRVKEQALGG